MDEDEIIIHPHNESSIDEDLPTEGDHDQVNVSVNNNSKQDTAKAPEKYHSIPQVNDTRSSETRPVDTMVRVVPETPKEQRSKRNRTLREFNFVFSSKSEGNTAPGIKISASNSKSTVQGKDSTWALNLDSSESEEGLNTIIRPYQFANPVNVWNSPTPGTSGVNTPAVTRFDKMVQTSVGRLNIAPSRNLENEQKENTAKSMRSFQMFADNVLVNIKRSTFTLSNEDRRPQINQMFPLQDQRANQRLDVRIYNPAIGCWRALRTLQRKFSLK